MLSDRFVVCLLLGLCLTIPSEFARSGEPSVAKEDPSRQSIPWDTLPSGLDPTLVIDLAMEDGCRREGIQLTPGCDDTLFVRRAYLDLVGRVPTLDEANSFLSQTDSNKRSSLIDRLLDSEEYAAHLAEVFDAILIGRTNPEQLRRRTEAGWIDYLQRAIRENRPWNHVSREILLARNESPDTQGANWYLYARNDKTQEIAEAVSKDFFGVRIDCAQCHDHPLASEIEQKHYWGLVAFFNRSKNVDKSHRNPRISESAIGGFSEFANVEGESKPNELVYLGNRSVAEQRPGKDSKEEDKDELYLDSTDKSYRVPKFSRREQFVENVLKDHPLFAKSMVNRMWGWMMGRGLVQPVDALDSYHPASHPELLEWLGRDFERSGFDIKRLIRSLALSRTYQRESRQTVFADPKWFSSSIPKPLTAEMLHRSFGTVLLPKDLNSWNDPITRQEFTRLFPDVLTEESISNVSQSLLLSNSRILLELITPQNSGLLSRLVSKEWTSEAIVQELFKAILGRNPDEDELKVSTEYLGRPNPKSAMLIEGLAWSLLTSAEFRFNH
jgi:hypothetical protein